MQKKIILLFILIIGVNYTIQSQILNIEKKRLNNDTSKVFIGNASFHMGIAQRATRVLSARGGVDMSYSSLKNNYIFIGSSHLIQVEDNDVISDASAHFRIHLNKKKWFSEELFTQIQYDQARGLNYRFLTGVGGRVSLVYSDKSTFAGGSGVMYEQEEWEIEEDYALTRLIKSTSYLSLHHTFTESFNLNAIAYYQAKFDSFFQPRVFGDVNLNFSITKKLTFTTKFSIIYDSAPVVPVREVFYNLTNGISLTF